MRKMTQMIVAGLVGAGALVTAQGPDPNKILADVRQALGGDKALAAVRTVAVVGRSQRTTPSGASMDSEFEIAIELPDKYMRRDVVAAMGNMSIYRTQGFNGDGVINEIDRPPQLTGGNMVIRMAGPGGAGADGTPPTPEQQAAGRRAMLLSAKQDFARIALGMFAQAFPAYPLAFSYAGAAESPDGKADVIEIAGEGDFTARLFVDQQTRLPLMITWMGAEPIVRTVTSGGPGDGAAAGGRGTVVTTDGTGRAPRTLTPEERERMMREAQAAAQQPPRRVEFRLFYSDYKSVDGVMLPHRFQRSVDGKPAEEITFEKVKLNQKIDAKKFQVSK